MNSISSRFAALELASLFADTQACVAAAYVADFAQRIVQVIQKCLLQALEYASQKFNFSLKKVTAYSADVLVDLAFDENHYQEKIDELRFDLLRLSHSTSCSETARVLSCHLVDYLQAYSTGAEQMDADLRPTWTAPLVDNNSSFTLTGEVVSTLLRAHPKRIASLLEVNFLKIFHNLARRLNEIQTANPQAGLDFLQDACAKLAAHFDIHSPVAFFPSFPSFPSVPSMALVHLSNTPLDTQAVAHDLLSILLPDGAKTLEIPGPECIAMRVQEKLYNILRDAMVPGLVKTFIPLLDDPLTRDNLLVQGFELLKRVINEDNFAAAQSNEPVSNNVGAYPRQEALNEVVGTLICSFLQYIDPLTKRRIVRHMSQQQLGNVCGTGITAAINQKPLIEHVNSLFALLLPIINSGGKWQEGAAQGTFLMAPSVFPKRREEFDLAQVQLEECKKRTYESLSRLVEEIGLESKGAMRLAANQFLDENEAAESLTRPLSSIWSAFEFVQNTFSTIQRQAKTGVVTFSVRHVCRKMRTLSKGIFIKIRQPIHAKLASSLTLDALQFLKRAYTV